MRAKESGTVSLDGAAGSSESTVHPLPLGPPLSPLPPSSLPLYSPPLRLSPLMLSSSPSAPPRLALPFPLAPLPPPCACSTPRFARFSLPFASFSPFPSPLPHSFPPLLPFVSALPRGEDKVEGSETGKRKASSLHPQLPSKLTVPLSLVRILKLKIMEAEKRPR